MHVCMYVYGESKVHFPNVLIAWKHKSLKYLIVKNTKDYPLIQAYFNDSLSTYLDTHTLLVYFHTPPVSLARVELK